jgi:hypothetical protein
MVLTLISVSVLVIDSKSHKINATNSNVSTGRSGVGGVPITSTPKA